MINGVRYNQSSRLPSVEKPKKTCFPPLPCVESPSINNFLCNYFSIFIFFYFFNLIFNIVFSPMLICSSGSYAASDSFDYPLGLIVFSAADEPLLNLFSQLGYQFLYFLF